MSHIFISYSRRDLPLPQKIVDALAKNQLEVWIDWNSIPKGEDWEQEIYRGIEEADAFLFLVSESSVASEMCNKEILHAVQNKKRILPVFIGDVDNRQVYSVLDKFFNAEAKKEIGKRNFIYCREGRDDFEKAIADIGETIRTDYDWLKFHRELQVKALRWDKRKDFSRLLLGKELREAEKQLAGAGTKDPPPTELQREFLLKSRRFARILNFATSVTLIAIAALIIVPYVLKERAIPGNWVTIPAGSFTMGMDPDEAKEAYRLCTEGALNFSGERCSPEKRLLEWSGRQVKATLEKFQIMDNEVTNAQYKQCVDAGECSPHAGWTFKPVDINKPATDLTWQEATLYCQWLDGRLPTEGEWEKAARGPDKTYFPWGNEWIKGKANLKQEGIGSLQSIARHAKSDYNKYGVSNMAGNVQEWTASEQIFHAEGSEFADSEVQLNDIGNFDWIIIRGGAYDDTVAYGMGSQRGSWPPAVPDPTIGFRCVCPPEKKTCKSPWDWKWIWSHDYYPNQ